MGRKIRQWMKPDTERTKTPTMEAYNTKKLKEKANSNPWLNGANTQNATSTLATPVFANNGINKPQCVLRHAVLTQQSAAVVVASYEIALEIAKRKKAHTIGETLLKPCMLRAVNLILGEASAKKMQQVALSNNIIQRHISKMSMDVKEQVLTEIKASPLFSSQLNESTDEVLDCVIKIVNYVKTAALNTRLFKDMNADHEVLLFYTAVHWLSKGNVVHHVYKMKDEIKLFPEVQEKTDLVAHFEDEAWNKRNWCRKTNLENIAMFEKLCGVMDESQVQLDQFLKDEITEHLQSLEKEFEQYFPELSEEQEALVRNPFDVSSIPDEIQDEFLDLKNDSTARDLFKVKSVTEFWCAMCQSYYKVSMIALRVLIPFASAYLCETGFSTLVNIKTKNRNRLDVGDDMRLALTNARLQISKHAAQMQHQASH
ncbi:protein FAM200A-like [Macrobrachium nipponense]|uniref:protein FAM200A-like n=1 Tax=Macrobrachium nipponense TaxID=159736 RepID=UPI0030C82F2F